MCAFLLVIQRRVFCFHIIPLLLTLPPLLYGIPSHLFFYFPHSFFIQFFGVSVLTPVVSMYDTCLCIKYLLPFCWSQLSLLWKQIVSLNSANFREENSTLCPLLLLTGKQNQNPKTNRWADRNREWHRNMVQEVFCSDPHRTVWSK